MPYRVSKKSVYKVKCKRNSKRKTYHSLKSAKRALKRKRK